MVEARGLVKAYGATLALDGANYAVESPGLHVIVGPNGSGKSTLLSIISGAERPDRGTVRVLGMDPWRDHDRLSGRLSALLDRTSVHPWLSGLELARLAARVRGVPWGEVAELAERLGVDRYWGRPYAGYSSGMRRRLLLLLAFTGWPEVILLDEPFQALDTEASRVVVELMAEAAGRGSTIIAATHTVAEGLLESAATVARMELGRIVAHGPPAEVNASAAEVAVRVECRR